MTELFVIHCESVGHHPVLHPGECFEYMSGTDLNTMHGTMCGYFNMALVKKGTSYGQVGDSLDALPRLFSAGKMLFRAVSPERGKIFIQTRNGANISYSN